MRRRWRSMQLQRRSGLFESRIFIAAVIQRFRVSCKAAEEYSPRRELWLRNRKRARSIRAEELT